MTKDVQNQPDTRKVPIDRVGVKGVKYPIVVEDRANGVQHTIADLDIYVNLPHEHRGTHMSRFIEVLNRYHQENLVENIKAFMQDIKESLNADKSFAHIKFTYFMQKTAPVSKISSLMSYECSFKCTYDTEFEMWIGAKIPVTSLCPCSKEISAEGAHNQRSYITIELVFKDFIWLEEIIETAESVASCEIYSLLKRSDEKYVTEKAYANPAFVEDIVRDITLRLNNDKRVTKFRVESENMESIHNHNAYAYIQRNKENK